MDRRVICLLSSIFLSAGAWAAGWDEGGGEAWRLLIAKAKQEPPLVIAGCADIIPSIAKAFRADTGLDTSIIVGAAADTTNRFRAEVQSGRNTIDVRVGGATDVDFAKSGLLYPIKDLVVLPDVQNPGLWQGGEIPWVDNAKRFMPMPSQYVSGRPIVNRLLVDPASIRSMKDLLKPEFKGKIAAYDPTGGAGGVAASYLVHVYGIEFVKRLFVEQKVMIGTDQRQLAEWGARGLYPVIFGIDPLFVQRFQALGIDTLEVVIPEDAPGTLSGGCNVLAMPKSLPHPASAAVFANWFLSSAGQKALVEVTNYPSRRKDVEPLNVPKYIMPLEGRTYLDQYSEDWYINQRLKIRDELSAALK